MSFHSLTRSVEVCLRVGGWSRRAMLVAPVALAALLVAATAGAQSIYQSNGELGDWTVTAGTLVINTDAMTMTWGAQVKSAADIDGVAVFRFRNLTVNSSVSVTVSGARPLSITATGDIFWGPHVFVAPGTLGGGMGGQGGNGGAGGAGGSGSAGGAGGNGGRGGDGGENSGVGHRDGYPGAGGLTGGASVDGVNGSGGAGGADGQPGGV
ncbi:MAG TPA: hypothetical protein PKL54_15235, partial [Candidatus Hydrogenedentes bacterium]|nr:hypothetical protein [Candidatus Hydrogenedentota bacterium]